MMWWLLVAAGAGAVLGGIGMLVWLRVTISRDMSRWW